MNVLVVGAGALGTLIAARLHASGGAVALATRDAESAARLAAKGLHVTGKGGPVSVASPRVAALSAYSSREPFDLVVLATKARDAIELAPRLVALLGPGGTLLPIQNGGVAPLLGERLGEERVLGGLSNLGATLVEPGVSEQRNAGHLLVGELPGGASARVEAVSRALDRGVPVKVSTNVRGAVWSKLLLNCSVTTLGAVAGRTLREYVAWPEGRELFDRTYDETLAVALASGARPERMIVEPIPPRVGVEREAWLASVLAGYGDLKASLLTDLELGRPNEIDFLNGWVVAVARQRGIAAPLNEAIVATVHAIARREETSRRELLRKILAKV